MRSYNIECKSKAKNVKNRETDYMKWGFYYLINILGLVSICAQDKGMIHRDGSSILQLKNSTLLVCLESNQNKLLHYEKAANASDCNAKCKQKIAETISEIKLGRDQFNKAFIKSFKNYYRFNPYVFCYDKDLAVLKKSRFQGNYFLNDSLILESQQKINPDSLFILIKTTSPNGGSEVWMFQTSDGLLLEHGFPFINENNFKSNLTRISSSDHIQKNVKNWLRRLNKDLFKFYNKIQMKNAEAAFELEKM